MGFLNRILNRAPKQKPLFAAPLIRESAKSQVTIQKKSLIQDAEDHPCDFELLEQMYLTIPIVYGAINKTVDSTVGPGFRIKSENPRSEEVAAMFMKDHNFDILLRQIIRDLLIYGVSFVEVVGNIEQLKPVCPKNVYAKRDENGKINGFVQLAKNGMKKLDFKPEEMLQFNFNMVGDKGYGTSIISPLQRTLERQLNIEKDMAVIFSRKAGAPIHIKMGDDKAEATSDDLAAMRSLVEDMRNNQEWVTNHHVDILPVGFEGKTLDPKGLLEYNQDQCVFGLEVPLVLLGKGNVPEGLAVSQQEAFDKRLASIQQSVEKVLERDLFPRIQGISGLTEFEWKSPSKEDNFKEVQILQGLLGTAASGLISPDLVFQIEDRIRMLLDFEPSDDKEMPVARLPDVKQSTPSGIAETNEVLDHVPLQEYVGFQYDEWIQDVETFIDSKSFEKRRFLTFKFTEPDHTDWVETKSSYDLKEILGARKLKKFREVLKDGFREGKSIRKLQNDIITKVRPGKAIIDVEAKRRGGEIVRAPYSFEMDEKRHALLMARTEAIRASNEGALSHMEGIGVKEVKWLTVFDERTCEYCASKDGEIFDIEEAHELHPPHIQCRCSWQAIVE